jgi:hypothetical protein
LRKEIRRRLLIEEIDQAIVMAHHLQVPGAEFLELIEERMDALEDKRRANENLAYSYGKAEAVRRASGRRQR